MTTTSYPESTFIFSRTLKAPRDLVFKVWTQAEHVAKWFGPVGLKLNVVEFAFEPEGRSHYNMVAENGNTMWGLWVFREISSIDFFTFVSAFSDDAGTIQSAPFGMDWPLELFNKITFTEDNGQTTVTLVGYPINATSAQEKVFADHKASMEGGWGGTFDALSQYLESLL